MGTHVGAQRLAQLDRAAHVGGGRGGPTGRVGAEQVVVGEPSDQLHRARQRVGLVIDVARVDERADALERAGSRIGHDTSIAT